MSPQRSYQKKQSQIFGRLNLQMCNAAAAAGAAGAGACAGGAAADISGSGEDEEAGTRGIWVFSCLWGPWAPKVRLCTVE